MPRFSGPLLKQRRTAANVSREALAVAVDRGVDTIRAYELGRAMPSADMVGHLADLLGVAVEQLFVDTDAETLAAQALEQGRPKYVGDEAVLRHVTGIVTNAQQAGAA